MTHLFQKLRRMFHRKPERHFVCGDVLFNMTAEERERYFAALEREKANER